MQFFNPFPPGSSHNKMAGNCEDESCKRKRRRKKPCPNPLFAAWLEEWRDEAIEKGYKSSYVYSKALNALRKYPLPLNSGKEAKVLENIGDKTANMLDKKLAEYLANGGSLEDLHAGPNSTSTDNATVPSQSKKKSPPNASHDGVSVAASTTNTNNNNRSLKAHNDPAPPKQRRRSMKEYVPAHRSGPYAILRALLDAEQKDCNFKGYLTKQDLISSAQPLCDSSFTIADPGSYYTAWSSVSTMIKKNLLLKAGHPPKYSLTEEGVSLAMRIVAAENKSTTRVIDRPVTQPNQTPSPVTDRPVTQPNLTPSSPIAILSSSPSPTLFINQQHSPTPVTDSYCINPSLSSTTHYDTPDSPLLNCKPSLSRPNHTSTASSSNRTATVDRSNDDDIICISDSPVSVTKHKKISSSIVKRESPFKRKRHCYEEDVCIINDDSSDDSDDDDMLPSADHLFNDLKKKRIMNETATTTRHSITPTSHSSFSKSFITGSTDTITNAGHAMGSPVFVDSPPSTSTAVNSPAVLGMNPPVTGHATNSSVLVNNLVTGSIARLTTTDSPVFVKTPPYSTISSFGSQSEISLIDSDDDDVYIVPLSERIGLKSLGSQQESAGTTNTVKLKGCGNEGKSKRLSSGSLSNVPVPNVPIVPITNPVPQPPSSSQLTLSDTQDSQQSFDANFSPTTELRHPLVTLRPGEFEVVLCVDNTESSANRKSTSQFRGLLLEELNKNGVTFSVRKLNVGDFLWIAREIVSGPQDQLRAPSNAKEIVLEHIIERKRMDDLASSIIDKRFSEQKFRMKNSGVFNPIYLVEQHGEAHCKIPESSLRQAITNTQVLDEFFIKEAKDIRDSIAYLTIMTRLIQQQYSGRTINGFTVETMLNLNEKRRCGHFAQEQLLPHDSVAGIPFSLFNDSTLKNKTLTVSEMFARQLIQVPNSSAEKAAAILELYPTPSHLRDAYTKCTSEKDRENLLTPLRTGECKRRFGPLLSSLMYKIYWKGSAS